MCIAKCKVPSVKCEVWSVQYTGRLKVSSVKCGVDSVKCKLWSVQWKVESVKCKVWSGQCTVWNFRVWIAKCQG